MDFVNWEVLALISVLTTLTTECIKTLFKKLDKDYISNIIAVISAIVLSGVICVIYPVIMQGVTISPQLIFKAVIMAFFAVLCATLSYKTVIETLNKLKE